MRGFTWIRERDIEAGSPPSPWRDGVLSRKRRFLKSTVRSVELIQIPAGHLSGHGMADMFLSLFFVREDKPEMNQIAVRWYDLDTDELSMVTPFTLVKKYGTLQSHSLEHPFELMAYGI